MNMLQMAVESESFIHLFFSVTGNGLERDYQHPPSIDWANKMDEIITGGCYSHEK